MLGASEAYGGVRLGISYTNASFLSGQDLILTPQKSHCVTVWHGFLRRLTVGYRGVGRSRLTIAVVV